MIKKYKNVNFPYDFDNEKLLEHTKECMDEAIKKGDDIESIVFSIRAQLGLAEYHKRQNDRFNFITIGIAFLALVLAFVGVCFQVHLSKTPQKIESQDIQEIKTNVDFIRSDKKMDSLLFFVKEVTNNQKTLEKRFQDKK